MFIVLGQKLTGKAFHVLNGFFKNLGRNLGANKVFIGTHDQKTYFKIIEHQRYGTFKVMVLIQGKKAAVENHSGYSRLGMGESNFTPQN